jgi:uncharacterized protein YdeI (YjbR/CyaY-like superfamily)
VTASPAAWARTTDFLRCLSPRLPNGRRGWRAASDGGWIKIAKKDAGIESVSHPEALEIALCFGWMDSRREALDERYLLQRYTPRRARSRWSRINREKVERLIADGRMRPAGLAEVERAKADGRWDAAYAGQRSATVPDDLQRELDKLSHPHASMPTSRRRPPLPRRTRSEPDVDRGRPR